MSAGDILALFKEFGPMGLMVGYVIWDKGRVRQQWKDHEERRLKVDEDRIETDKQLALALQALTFKVRGEI